MTVVELTECIEAGDGFFCNVQETDKLSVAAELVSPSGSSHMCS
jgi:hypothetical protein